MTPELRRDVLLPLIVLMVILVLTTAGSVSLLARMAPAIEQIIAENVYSLEATEQMLAVLASGEADESAREQFTAALERAEGNLTEAHERELLVAVRHAGAAALAGEPAARRETIDTLVALGGVNRSAVVRGDEHARRLGYAGAWAAVFMGALSFAWALLAIRRARRRIVEPLQEVGSVLDAVHAGDSFRRCRQLRGPAEVEKIMRGIDDLLDARALRSFAEQPSLREVVDRQILLHLLEQRPGPAWVITGDGSVDAANRAGLDELAGEDGEKLREQLVAVAAGEPSEHLLADSIEGVPRIVVEAVEPGAS